MNDNNFYYESNGNEGPEIESRRSPFELTSTSSIFVRSYLWMFLGVLISFVSGLGFTKLLTNILINGNDTGLYIFFGVSMVSFIGQLVLCYSIRKNALFKLNFGKAFAGLIVISLLMGISFSGIFLFFENDILYRVFGTVAIYYLVLTAISAIFKNKVKKIEAFAAFGLVTLLICTMIVLLFSIFGGFGPLYIVVNILGLIVFSIVTIVDVQRMKRLIESAPDKKCAAVLGAFELYLDFINIFLYVLRLLLIFGRNTRRR